ncbi:hypothetical protein KW784_01945 [Candidatus Parcubacteria bacterium]|nr:hypothetical protein [Candidatus Parcubacteria bacterium]
MKTLSLALFSLALLPSIASAQSVDILWQGVNYAPPFYQGGSLWSQEGSLIFYAVPQGLGNPASLSYKWIKDGTVLGSVSGVGKNALYSNDPLFGKPQRVEVEIMNGNDEIVTQSFVIVSPVTPEPLVYEKSPLYGFLFNREASSGYRLGGQEVAFAAFPLFFSAKGRDDGSLTYAWRSNAGSDSTDSSVTYRIPDGASGSARVSVKAANPSSIRQMAEKSFLVQFGNEN